VLAYLKGSFGLPLSRVFSYLGKISYSMYARHTIVCMIVVQYLAAPFDEPYLIGLIIVLPSTIALSAISHYLIESPFLALRMPLGMGRVANSGRASSFMRQIPITTASGKIVFH
jgi:peptidoglycan/LPS O-acetylase OafA/YrhL